MGFNESLFSFLERRVSPVAGRISTQRHVMAIRDGFISAMPFMIVGSFLLVFAFPPFSKEATFALARWWLDLSGEHQSTILTPFNMTMGIMSIYICAGIAYNLAQSYKLEPFMCAMLALMSFLLVAAPQTDSQIPSRALGGIGIFTAMIVGVYVVEVVRFLKEKNIGIKLPEQVPSKIKQSFDLLIPIIVVILTLYPISVLIQSNFNMLMPEAIMAIFEPLISAADSLPAVLIAVLIAHLLWFAGIHGAVIVSGLLQAFWLTNVGLNQTALATGQPIEHIFMEGFWNFFVLLGGSGSTLGLVILYMRSRSAHLRSIGKISFVPSVFNINEPVIFGTPLVMNPTFFIPFITAPVLNAVIAYTVLKLDIVSKGISLVPWTAPAPIGAAWLTGWDWRAPILMILLAILSTIIYYPFFKMYEKQLLAEEASVNLAK